MSAWSNCTGQCEGGTAHFYQTRFVQCITTSPSGASSIVPEDACVGQGLEPPPSFLDCSSSQCLSSYWQAANDWSPCSVPCTRNASSPSELGWSARSAPVCMELTSAGSARPAPASMCGPQLLVSGWVGQVVGLGSAWNVCSLFPRQQARRVDMHGVVSAAKGSARGGGEFLIRSEGTPGMGVNKVETLMMIGSHSCSSAVVVVYNVLKSPALRSATQHTVAPQLSALPLLPCLSSTRTGTPCPVSHLRLTFAPSPLICAEKLSLAHPHLPPCGHLHRDYPPR